MIAINFINDYSAEYDVYEAEYKDLAGVALQVLKLTGEYEMSVTLVDNTTIHQMNKDYRFKDYATDVISFENDIVDMYDDTNDLGDIFISVDKAIEQANDYNHSIKRELSFLFVHGLLHCLGYDHLNEDEEKEMFEIQEVILGALKKTDN